MPGGNGDSLSYQILSALKKGRIASPFRKAEAAEERGLLRGALTLEILTLARN